MVYGTREARVITGSGRWITVLPDGSLMFIDGVDVKDGSTVLYRYLTWSRSYDSGMTWTDPVEILCQEGDYNVSGGGVTYDPNTGRILVVSFQSDPPSSKLFFLYSEMIRMLDYGALAQLYSARTAGTTVAAEDLANSIVDSELRDFINSYDMGAPVAYDPGSASTDGVFFANLTLNESIDLNIYTNTSHIRENEKLVVKLDDVELTEDQYEMVTSADGVIHISYSFHADKMNKELTVAIVDKDDDEAKVAISLSIRKYAHICMYAYETDETLCAILIAMLDYGALVQRYANPDANDLANRYVSADQRATLTDYPWPEN